MAAAPPHPRSIRALLVFLLLQSLLLTIDLKLLPMSSDEMFTISAAAGTPAQIVATVRSDIHPPLYFLLAHWWLRIPHGENAPLAWIRLLSALFGIAAAIAIDRLWLRSAAAGVREWFLLFWTFSPCLLLFARMACSYSLQTALSVVAIWCAIEFARNPTGWKRLGAFTASLTALLYTHYLPGLAIWAGANALLIIWPPRVHAPRWKTWLLPNLIVAAAYLPWLITLLAAALPRPQHKAVLGLTGSIWAEPVLKLAYWFYSFAFGEAIPIWLLAASALLALPCCWLFYSGVRAGLRDPDVRHWLIPGMVIAILACIGAAHWVAYAFMGARLLFLLPLFLLALAAGIESQGRAGAIAGILLFAANLAGVWAYFGGRDLLHIGYLIPNEKIASAIVILSSPDSTAVWIDSMTIDDSAVLEYYLPRTFRVRNLTSLQSAAEARAELPGSNIRTVWFIRNTGDPSFAALQNEMNRTWYNHTVRPFLPVSATQQAIMRALAFLRHQTNYRPPRYLYEVWEYHKPG